MTIHPFEMQLPGLKGKRVLVTGAGSGIGRAFCEAFAAHGCRLVANDLRADLLDDLARSLGSQVEYISQPGSISDADVVSATFDAADKVYSGIDIVINNAGISMNKPTLEMSVNEWKRTLDVNLTSLFMCSNEAARRMSGNGGGVILNMASMYGLVAGPERLAYCVTKSGVVMMTKALAIEWAKLGIRVNAIAPGYVETALVTELLETQRINRDAIQRRTPQGRLGRPEEIAAAGAFLCSPCADHITGHILSIDGGWTAYGYI